MCICWWVNCIDIRMNGATITKKVFVWRSAPTAVFRWYAGSITAIFVLNVRCIYFCKYGNVSSTSLTSLKIYNFRVRPAIAVPFCWNYSSRSPHTNKKAIMLHHIWDQRSVLYWSLLSIQHRLLTCSGNELYGCLDHTVLYSMWSFSQENIICKT